jgi:hypothetical protein
VGGPGPQAWQGPQIWQQAALAGLPLGPAAARRGTRETSLVRFSADFGGPELRELVQDDGVHRGLLGWRRRAFCAEVAVRAGWSFHRDCR